MKTFLKITAAMVGLGAWFILDKLSDDAPEMSEYETMRS